MMATSWMTLNETAQYFQMHPVHKGLFVAGMAELSSQHPGFNLLHPGTALKGKERTTQQKVLKAIAGRIQCEEYHATQVKVGGMRINPRAD